MNLLFYKMMSAITFTVLWCQGVKMNHGGNPQDLKVMECFDTYCFCLIISY